MAKVKEDMKDAEQDDSLNIRKTIFIVKTVCEEKNSLKKEIHL